MKFGLNARSVVAAFLALLVSIAMMGLYLTNALHGRLGNHLLPSTSVGVPSSLQDRGFEPFVVDGTADPHAGGQFYFFIANDPAVGDETHRHLDADAFRFQQILLPVTAWVVSRLALQDWVRPFVYYATNLLIVLAGTVVGARYLTRSGIGARWIVPWLFSLGVQISLLNGLPDAAADALLMIAIVSMMTGHRIRFVLFSTLAVLGRSSNIVLPLALMAVSCWEAMKVRGFLSGRGFGDAVAHRWLAWIPLLVFIGWEIIVRIKFGHGPLGQDHGIAGPPFRSWFRAAGTAIDESPSPQALVSLLTFAALIVTVGRMAWVAIPKAPQLPIRALAVSIFVTAFAAACFGDSQMRSEAEYMRSIGPLFLSVLILPHLTGRTGRKVLAGLFVLTTILSFAFIVHDRLAPLPVERDRYYDRYLHTSQVTDPTPIACLSDPRAFDSKIASFTAGPSLADTLLDRMRGERIDVATVAVTNQSTASYPSGAGVGSVNLTYRWLTADGGAVVAEGVRSFIPGGVAPGETKIVSMVMTYPKQAGAYLLRISLVQEHCAWFYERNPASRLDRLQEIQ